MKYDDFKVLFNSGDRVDYIVVQINEGDNIKDVAAAVEKKLRTFRGVNEKTQDFSILTPEELLNSFQSILVIITAFLISVAGISLVVGAIGIANTMYTSVLERTKEIGVMKAIGARNSDILLIFVIEAGLIGMVGGILGVALGIGVSKAMEYVAINQLGTNLLRAAIPPYLVIGCIFFAFIIGAVSGILPARHASKIKVVDAIRYE
jgi:putative ABC transport system permease protein